MLKYAKHGMLSGAVLITTLFSTSALSAAPNKAYESKSHSTKAYSKKAYSKKAPYAGYGQSSKVNGRSKTKIVSGHTKKTAKGYIYVNPYARSE